MTSNKPQKPRLAMLISGGGRTMLNIADRIQHGRLSAEIAVVIASRTDAGGIEKAKSLGLTTHVVPRKTYADVQSFSEAVWSLIRPANIDVVCLAGFLSLLTVPRKFAGRVMNIHPALLPKYGGKGMYGHRVHEAVIAAGEKESGCTVHLCDNEYDNGPILVQRRCPVLPGDTADTLAARVFEQECLAYPEAIRAFQQKNLTQRRERKDKMNENEIATIIVDLGYHIHCKLGPGLLESVYEAVLAHELRKRGLPVEQQVPMPVIWDDIHLEVGFRSDLIVGKKVIVELKSVESTTRSHKKQLLTYLRLSERRLGLLMNFGEELFKDGVSRVVNGLPEAT